MRELSPKTKTRRPFAALAAIGVIMSFSALQAHAAVGAKEDITITMEMPKIETAADRAKAVRTFRAKASDACEIKGIRGTRAHHDERECVSALVKSFEQKIDTRFKSVGKTDVEAGKAGT